MARRQALALAGLGCPVRLIDLAQVPGGGPRKVESWNWGYGSGVSVDSWELFADPLDAFSAESVAASEEVLSTYAEQPGSLLVQEALLGSVASAASRLRLGAIWQPNDYSFVCARSWLLTGTGQRCQVEPGRFMCSARAKPHLGSGRR